MILGSHNTMSYLKPRKWWMYLVKFAAKCQKLTIEEQYNKGARFFDFRIAILNNTPIFSHGLIEYKGNPEDVFKFLNTKTDVYCRITLEKGDDLETFKYYVSEWMKKYPNTKVVQISKKGYWADIMQPNSEFPAELVHKYASANTWNEKWQKYKGLLRYKTWSGCLLDDLWPWIYAKFHNKKNIKQYKESDVILFIDFIK